MTTGATIWAPLASNYTDKTGTPGAASISTPAGRVRFAAGQTTLIVTNPNCLITSLVQPQIETNDATAKSVEVTMAAGSFTLRLNAACTAAVDVSFVILNVY